MQGELWGVHFPNIIFYFSLVIGFQDSLMDPTDECWRWQMKMTNEKWKIETANAFILHPSAFIL
jgi:hypothetical protein